ncbi:MAG: hypothetical protein A3K19_30900 [Lentisphaerae bacterium RIFOXYB12_FULL_65_16]|nr:MAG: hypothetical protein A3K18_03995 [Lentisphaerae bacterium RIFOXYA12_64_32]OGV88827.1 MAG: hypothetical protein A3K19_30900 [Lentisphaerae bacterium RIFOXYB12_FULL_65_16]
MRYFPINFDVSGRDVLVVGGGRIALRKVKSLVACAARVTVVSPEFCGALLRMKGVRRVQRRYRKADLRGACLAISATDCPDVNQRVWEHAYAAGIPVNVVDQPQRCSFTVPAVFCQGDLVLTISTGGGGPALARKLRERLSSVIGPAYAKQLSLLREFRPKVQSVGLPISRRMKLLKQMADDPVRKVIERRGKKAARRLLQKMLNAAVASQRAAR